ncbi:hypothetical protein Lal_00043770 [Lupinus albus]|nr:hypothetical protein Lal_00043770 [Lupinus albus]
MHPFQKSGFVARISSRITTVIRVVDTIKQTITVLPPRMVKQDRHHGKESFKGTDKSKGLNGTNWSAHVRRMHHIQGNTRHVGNTRTIIERRAKMTQGEHDKGCVLKVR